MFAPHLRTASLWLVLLAACASPSSDTTTAPDAPAAAPARSTPAELAARLGAHAIDEDPLGPWARPVGHASPQAQAWFDQGLRWLYGFNQDAAAACFARAAQLSPDCPMAWWGIAHAYSVDINNPFVTPQEAVDAEVAAREAARLAAGTELSPIEAGLIAAAQERAVSPIPADRTALDEAYQRAVAALYADHGQDPDVAFFHAEAMMNLQPWNYWTPDGEPVGNAEAIVAALERAMARTPEHPGNNHLYIHAVESAMPARAEAAADRLGQQMPGSGHLIHMPSHIYIRVGRYDDATRVNLAASELDQQYFADYGRPSFYRLYWLHNLHFAAFAAMMEGRKGIALDAIERMEEESVDSFIQPFAAMVDGVLGSRLHVLVRFGLWEDVLATEPFADYRLASNAMRHYARTVALANLGRTDEARDELARFDAAAAATPEGWMIAFNPCQEIYALAHEVAEAEILWREGEPEAAIELLEAAVERERNLTYTEPPPWMIPVRHTLGAIQVASGRAADAEPVYRADLAHNPGNAWSLLGLHQSLVAQGKDAEALALQPRVEAAWSRADVDPPASCYCGAALELVEAR